MPESSIRILLEIFDGLRGPFTRPSFANFVQVALGWLLEAVIEATEESIWNALCAAETMIGLQGRTSHAIPLDRLVEIAAR